MRKVLFTLITLLLVLHSSAQTDFLSEMQKQQTYFDSLIIINGADSMQGTGYTQFKRWHRYWAPKLTAGYDYDEYQANLLNYVNNYVSPQGSGTNPNWHLIGPNDIPPIGTLLTICQD